MATLVPSIHRTRNGGNGLFTIENKADSSRIQVKIKARSSQGRVDELELLDANGRVLKGVTYTYLNQDPGSPRVRERVFLPEQPITVGFNGPGPTITIGGETRRYSELETIRHQGGRRCVVDYEVQEVRGRILSLPSRIGVYSGDLGQMLRCARLYNFVTCEATPDGIEAEAKRCSAFDANDLSCREMLLKHWLKNPRDIAPADVNALHWLRTRFVRGPVAGASAGQEFKRVNTLLQLGWMLGHRNQLERAFRDYLSLLSANRLNRMILFGGQNIVETTARWGQLGTTDRLLCVWLDCAVSHNDVTSVLEFATANLAKGHFWTLAGLMNKTLEVPRISTGERFVAQAVRCIALARLREIEERTGLSATDLATAQKRWAMTCLSDEALWTQINGAMDAAQRAFAPLDRPTQAERSLKRQLDEIRRNLSEHRSVDNEPEGSERVEEPRQDD